MSWTTDGAQVAALIKHHPDDPSIADEGRRRLKVAKARRLIRALTSERPRPHARAEAGPRRAAACPRGR